ncbi:MAG TPA: ATP-binding cassette domain-containing protein [Acidimicrobiales bacterium]|nr:ATP-binding cassette domain-containing protein [Acidimicrobiales bacterium]
MVLGTWITQQLVFNGVVTGLSTALVALGVVLTYRSTRVINFAVGNMGLPAAVVMALLCINYGLGFWPALAVSLLVGALFAAAVELLVVRRLFRAPRVIVLVATIGVAQLAQAIVRTFPDIESRSSARYPVPIGAVWEDVAGLRVTGPQVIVLVVVPLVAIALGWLLNRTTFGHTVTASADEPDLARLSGISPKIVSTFVWVIAGLLSSTTLIMLSGIAGSPSGIEGLGPSTLNRALAAAVIGGMVSFPRTVAAGIGLGIADAVLRFNFPDQVGLIDFVVFLAIVVAVFMQTRTRDTETATFSFAPRVRPVPERLRQIWWVRNLPRLTGLLALVAAAVLPLIVTETSRHLLYTQILLFAIAAMSLVVVTGWSGQLSLGQMAFAGVGALFAAAANRGIEFDVGWGDARLDVHLQGVNWAVSILLGSAFAALVAVVVGVGALRVRGLLLAVVTFSFGLAAQQYIYRRPFFSDGRTTAVPFERQQFLGIDLTDQRNYYWFCLAVLAAVVVVVARLRRSGVGRSIIAVRDNPDAAAGYTVRPAPAKLLAFAVAGALAGLAGGLMAGTIQNVPLSERIFQVDDSLQLVAMVVIGGLGSVAGAVLGALWVVGLPAFFPDNDAMPLITSSAGLLILLLYFPGGLVQIGYSARDALARWLDARVPATSTARAPAVPASVRREDARTAPPEGTPALVTEDVRVRFGGIAAVDSVSIEVAQGEVVGLIGTNGAGKSTLLNAIGGFVPAEGRVVLSGDDVSRLDAASRARAGLGRTFQAARLFPELTARETVAVALEARGRSGFTTTALGLPVALRRERRRATETDELLSFLGLGRYADSYIADLSTGTRRIVELAGLLAVGAEVLCLDEPTAGVAQRETEAFGPLLLEVRRELGAAMVVIEHDMPLIMAISDRMYCLELGRVIAEGPPAAVRQDARVIASYLGTEHAVGATP